MVLGLLISLAAIFGVAYWDGYLLRREAAVLARERETLRRQNAQLREEIRLLQQPEYIERLAREQLGLVRPDEIAIIVVQPTPAPKAPPPPQASPPRAEQAPVPWWRRWLGRD